MERVNEALLGDGILNEAYDEEMQLAEAFKEWDRRQSLKHHVFLKEFFDKTDKKVGRKTAFTMKVHEARECCVKMSGADIEKVMAHLVTPTHLAKRYDVNRKRLKEVLKAQLIMQGKYVSPEEKRRNWQKELDHRVQAKRRFLMRQERKLCTMEKKIREQREFLSVIEKGIEKSERTAKAHRERYGLDEEK